VTPGNTDRLSLRKTVAFYNLTPQKKFGQNFIYDENLLAKIAHYARPLTHRTVIEIGPGPGGLTRALLAEDCKDIHVFEVDDQFRPPLEDLQKQDDRLFLYFQDALQFDFRPLLEGRVKIIANLPYNISTPVLFKWLPDLARIESLTLMFQKEVADRLTACPGTSQYGRLSVMCQWLSHIRQVLTLPKSCFHPQPKIESAVVQLTSRQASPPSPGLFKAMENMTHVLFSKRRKMLRGTLKPLFHKLEVDPDHLAQELDIDLQLRPENLRPEQFVLLAKKLILSEASPLS